MKRILAIMLVVILVLSSFTFAFANGLGAFNLEKNTINDITLEQGECKTVSVTISGKGNNNQQGGDFKITYPKKIEITSSGVNVLESKTYDFYNTDKSFTYDLEICALSDSNSINIDLFDGLDPQVPDGQDGTFISLGARVGLQGNAKATLDITVTEVPEDYTLTINYEHEDGSEAATKYTETLEDGKPYSIDSPDVVGYTPDQETVAGTITEDTEVTVTYTTNPKYSVSLNVSTIDGGVVSGAGDYKVGDTVTVTASTNLGYTFEGWIENTNIAEGDQTSSSFTFIMPEGNVEYTANFKDIIAPPPPPIEFYQLTLVSNPVGTGLLTGGGTYPASHPVPISATPENGFNFTNWTDEDGDEVSDIDGFVYTMPASEVTLTANFEADDSGDYTTPIEDPEEYILIINYVDEDENTVADTYTDTLEDGDDYSVESPVVTGYTPDIETVSGTITADTEATVTYTADDTKPIDDPTYSVLLTASPANGGNVTGFGTYSENDSVTITATAKEGYEFKEWTLDGDVESTDSTHNFTMPAQDLTLTAVFEEETSGDGGGTTNPTSSTNTYEMSIEKTAVQDEVFVGEDAEFEIVVTNEGNTKLTNITVKDDMIGLNETINLNERQSRTFKVSVKTEEEGILENTAEALHDLASYKKDSASVNVIPVLVDDEDTPESSPNTKDEEPKEEPEKEEIEVKDDPIPEDTPVKEDPETEEIYDETVPLDLPDTGVLPIELFYGLGALVSGAGVLVSKKK